MLSVSQFFAESQSEFGFRWIGDFAEWEEAENVAQSLATKAAPTRIRRLGVTLWASDQKPKGYFTTTQAAARMGIDAAHVRRLAGDGKLAGARKMGRDWLIPVRAAAAFQRGAAGRPKKTVTR